MKSVENEPTSAKDTAIGLLGQDTVREIEETGLVVMWRQDWNEIRRLIDGLINHLNSLTDQGLL